MTDHPLTPSRMALLQNQAQNSALQLSRYADQLVSLSELTPAELTIVYGISQVAAHTLKVLPAIYALSEATASGAAYGIGSFVDTNENPSNVKTLATVVGSNIVGGVIGGLINRMILSKAISSVKADNLLLDPKKIKEFRAALIKLASQINDVNGISDDTLNNANVSRENLKSVVDELIEATRTANIMFAVLGVVNIGITASNAYHGYKRNGDSLGYALAWTLTGPAGLGLSMAQGYANPIPTLPTR